MFSNKTIVLAISISLIAAGWVSGRAGFPLANHILMIAAAIAAGYPIAKNAYISARFKVVGIEALVTVASIGAILIGEYWEAAAVTSLFALGSFLEAKTLDKTRNAIRKLMDLAPLTAVVKDGDGEREVPVEAVVPGDVVVVRPGGKIPVDGKVIKGHGTVNQAPVTGEPIPVGKEIGDMVYSGTVNEVGYMEILTERSGDDTTFARILNLVEEAQESKAPTERFLSKFSKYYTPGIILLALLVYIITRDIRVALTLLVIACPGALVIATPISIVAAIGNGAKRGVLIKGGEHLEKAGKINIVAFDKTGTLTYGKPWVKEVKAFSGTEKELLRKAAGIEASSEHHIAKAILEKAGTDVAAAESFEVLPGKGAAGLVNGKRILVGNRSLLLDNGVSVSDEIEKYLQEQEEKGSTSILAAEEKTILGVISVTDKVREEAASVIKQLKSLGVHKVVMLTGDNRRTASFLANELGIDEYKAGLLPQEKVNAVKELMQHGNVVAMIGDGINDAPALAAADVGMAMGGAGTDVAIEVSDVVLMSDHLDMVPYAVGLSKAALKNIKQNITFAILVVMVLLAGVLSKYVFLASGMLAHEASVMAVILNAIRLLGYKPKSIKI